MSDSTNNPQAVDEQAATPDAPSGDAKRVKRRSRWHWLKLLWWLPPVLIIVPLALALGTEWGTQKVWSLVEPRLPEGIAVDSLEGRLIGPLEVRGVQVETPGLDLQLDRALLDWKPSRLLVARVHISQMIAEGVDVALKPVPDQAEEPEEPGPLVLDFRAPVSIMVEAARLSDFSLQPAPDADIERVNEATIDTLKWTRGGVSVARLTLDAPRTGQFEAELDAGLDRNAIRVNQLALLEQEGDLAFTLTGRVRQSGETVETLDMDIDTEWAALRWPLFPETQADGTAGQYLVRSPSGQLTADGTLNDLKADLVAALRTTEGTAQVKLDGARRGEQINADLSWTGLTWPLEAKPQVRTQTGQFSVRGQLDNYDLNGTARINLPDAPPDPNRAPTADAPAGLNARVQLDGSGSLEQLRLRALRVEARDTVATLDGQVDWSDAISTQFHLVANQVNPARLDASLAEFPGKINIETRGQARVDGEDITANLEQFSLVGTLRDQPAKLNAQARITPERVVVPTFVLNVFDATARGQADVGLQPLSGSAAIQLKNIKPGQFDERFPGTLGGIVSLSFATQDGERLITTDVANIEGTLRDRPVEILASARMLGDEVDINFLRLQSDDTNIVARGVVSDTISLTVDADSDDLGDLWPGLRGELDAEVQATGRTTRPRVSATATADGVRYEQYRLDTLTLEAEVDLADGSVVNVAADIEELHGNGIDAESLSLNVTGSAASHQLAFDAKTIDLNASIAAAGGFDLERYEWEGQLSEGQLAPIDLPPWRLQQAANLRVNPETFNVQRQCWSANSPLPEEAAPSESTLCLSAEKNDGLTLANVEVVRLAYDYIQPLLPPKSTVDGSLSGGVAYGARPGQSTIELNLKTTEGRIVGQPPGQTEEVNLVFAPGFLRATEDGDGLAAEINLPLGRTDVDAPDDPGGVMATLSLAGTETLTERPLDANLDLRVRDLDFVSLFFPELLDVRGEMIGDLTVSGTIAQPTFDGGINVADAAASVDSAGIDLSAVSLEARGDNSSVLTFAASAKSGKGTIKLEGDAALFGKREVNAKVTGQRFLGFNTEDAVVYVTPDLTLELVDRDAKITGRITVPEAELTPQKRESSPDIVKVSSDQVIIGPAETLVEDDSLRVTAEVTAKLGDQVTFEGFGLTSGISGEITVRSKPGRDPTATGELVLTDGAYKAYGQNLDIQSGRLIFAGGPVTSPGVDVRAARYPAEDIEVGVRVRGSVAQPKFELYSRPGMPETRQLSYLVLGRPLDQEGGATGGEQALLTNAALSLGLRGSGFVSDFLKEDIGLDDVQIGAGAGRGNDQAALVLGKYLTPDLYVSYGVGLLTPGQSFRIRYSLSDNWKVETEAGAETGGDVIYTIER